MEIQRDVTTFISDVKQFLVLVPVCRTDAAKELVDVMLCRAERRKKSFIVSFSLGHSDPVILESGTLQIRLLLPTLLAVFIYARKDEKVAELVQFLL